MNQILNLIGRKKELFTLDIKSNESELSSIVKSSSFLVIGGADSIGQAVTKEIFKRNPPPKNLFNSVADFAYKLDNGGLIEAEI